MIMDEQIEELVEHLERAITALTERLNRIEQNRPAPLTLSTPMTVYAQPQRLGFYNRMTPMNPS